MPLSSFLRIISLLLVSSLRARSSPGGRLFLGLTSGVPQALFRLLLSKSQEQLTVESVESNWISREMDVAQYFGHDRRILLANWLKSEISWRLIWFSFMTGVGMNFKLRESKLICSAVNCVSERFLMCCLRNSIVSQKHR